MRTALLVWAALLFVISSARAAGPAQKQDAERRFVVTLDAGHGGHDTGAQGIYSNEKNITLAVVKKLGELIDRNLGKDVKVVYTRDGDYFVTLQGRAEIANDAKSDLFISVHINSVAKTSKNRLTVEGCQVYTLGLHKTAENLSVAKRENAVMELDGTTPHLAGFDPESQESDIVFELSQSKRLDQSIEFADAVHSELVNTAGRAPKGVRQAGFWVLWATSAPAVLIELDFICNPTSENFLNSEEGQTKMATAVYNAFCSYFNTYGPEILGHKAEARRIGSSAPAKDRAVPPPPARKPKAEAPAPLPPEKDRLKPIDSDEGSARKPQYRIQVATSSRPLGKRSPELKGNDNARYYKEGGVYKYTLGPWSSEKKARKELKKLREDFPDAFIIIVQEGRRTGMLPPK